LSTIQKDEVVSINRNDLVVLMGLVERNLHKAVELDQIVTLSGELLKERLEELRLNSEIINEINERLESMTSSALENAGLLQDVKRKLKEVLVTTTTTKNVINPTQSC
jgi:hypothetical protein